MDTVVRFCGRMVTIFTRLNSISASRTGVRLSPISTASSFSLIWLPGASSKCTILCLMLRRA